MAEIGTSTAHERWSAAEKAAELRVSHDGPVRAVTFSPDGTRLATASADNTARITEIATARDLAVFPHSRPVKAVVFDSTGTRLATASDDGSARVYPA